MTLSIWERKSAGWIYRKVLLLFVWLLFAGCEAATAQESPYFVTDHHHLPEAGAIGIANYSVFGLPKQGNQFLGTQMEFEYRATKWWATAVQLNGQTTWNESTLFTGFSWTNKFKLYPSNRIINSVLSIGFENANAADKSIAEIEGHSAEEDFAVPNDIARETKEHELELKLVLSRDHRGWNFAGNVLAAKNLMGEPWEFGYSLGVSRALSTANTQTSCVFCRKSFAAGLEFYGGLGDVHSFGLQNTSHYLGPDISWQLSERLALKAGPHFGLTPQSQHAFVHFGIVYDIPAVGKDKHP